MHGHDLGCTTASFGGKLPEKLRAMRAAGFSSTELWPRDLFENAEGPDVAVELLAEAGLTVSCYQALRNYEGQPAPDRDHKLGIAEQLMDQMALVGAGLLVLCSNTDPASSDDPERLAEDLRRLGDLARTRKVRIAYEALSWGSRVRDYRDAWRLVETVDHPNVGLMLDCFHIFVLGLPLDGIAAMRSDKVFLVEVADLPGMRLPPVEISRHYRLFPGEGIGAVDAFIEQVRAIGYGGCLSVEIFNAQCLAAPPAEVAARAMHAMNGMLGRVRGR